MQCILSADTNFNQCGPFIKWRVYFLLHSDVKKRYCLLLSRKIAKYGTIAYKLQRRACIDLYQLVQNHMKRRSRAWLGLFSFPNT